MAEEDEIDILGDFSFNSCFAQNNQGIPSCSNREDTVHPQWLLDSVSTNWYDNQTKDNARIYNGPSRRLTGNRHEEKYNEEVHSSWSDEDRKLLFREMAKYGRNVRKISQTLKTKTEAEIQALIEAEFGVHLETPSFGLAKHEDHDDTPTVAQEEIVTDDVTNVLSIITTGSPTVMVPKKPFRKKTHNVQFKHIKSEAPTDKQSDLDVNSSEIFYDEDMTIGSTESVGLDLDSTDILSQKLAKQQKEKLKAVKKIGNHRRKVSRNYDRGKRNSSKELLKSPVGRQRKDSSLSEDSGKSPKMQIVLGSGQALPLSEGEQVIKIEKKKDSDPESDIEVDVDSDNEDTHKTDRAAKNKEPAEEPIAVPLRKLQPMPRRQKKINLNGDGGYTIMHTASGDLFEVGAEPRKERAPKKPTIHLIQCRIYNQEKPAPYPVRIYVSTLISMDVHGHTSRAEVMGLAGGTVDAAGVTVTRYRRAAAAAGGTHCDMDPVSQASAAEHLSSTGTPVCAWHHSHPEFPPAPSATDLATQAALQRALERGRSARPLLGVITSQHWPPGRAASQFRCLRVEDSDAEIPVGYQFSVKLVPDLTIENMPEYLNEVRTILLDRDRNEFSVDLANDVCPQAGITYLEKCISSVTHHMHSAGYEDNDPVTLQLIQGIRDVFR